ncbi:MAG: ABC transporter ATP-binding protein, partial [Nitrospinaceae bacterium]|nr:ABC transporter ATP-binding protein [Nitrospinaceae bacterium]
MHSEADTPLLTVENITKRFGQLIVNDHVSFDVQKGHIHCLLGENGAGKSTLAKCIYGASKPDSGRIIFKGREVSFSSPRDAIRQGIGMVHQHFVLSEPMNAVENIIVGEESTGAILNLQKETESIQKLCDQYDVTFDLSLPISQLSVGEQQWIEILKALYVGVDLLLLDEPTAVLTPQEVERLFSVISKMAEEGISVILITHKLHEVMDISKKVTVLRKAKSIATVDTKDSSRESLAKLLVGRDFDFRVDKVKVGIGKPVLEIEELSVLRDNLTPAVDCVSLTLHEGEILGLAGVSGNGQSELFDALLGVRQALYGRIRLGEEEITNLSPAEISNKGMASVPQDRLKQGLIGNFSVKENLILGAHGNQPYCSGGVLNMKAIMDFSEEAIDHFDIRTMGPEQKVEQLSGGNLQKVILAREISHPVKALVASSPTRGLDINATYYVYNRFLELLKMKAGIL